MPFGTNLRLDTSRVSRWLIKPELALFFAFLILGIASFLILSRQYTNFGVEIDFLGRFVPTAERLQQGQALAVKYHLPFYPALLAVIEPLSGGWFEAALIISWISTLVVLAISYRLARELLDWQAGLSVIVVCSTSSLFLTYSVVASTEMLFLALYQSTCLFGFLAFRDRKQIYWLLAGILIAVSYLTRSNGIILLLFFGVPFLLRDERSVKAQAFLSLATGILIGMVPWFAYAWFTGSPLVPTQTHVAFATAFYDKTFGIYAGEFMQFAEQKFSNIWEVLVYKPVRIPVAYAENVARFMIGLPQLILTPVLMLLLPGLLIIILRPASRFVPFLAVLTIAHVLLTCFSDFAPRYVLFLLPFLALGLSKTLEITLKQMDQINSHRIFYCIVGLCFLASLTIAVGFAWRDSRTGQEELAAVVPVIRSIAANEDIAIVTRRPNLWYHTQAMRNEVLYSPNMNTLDDLKERLLAYRGAPSLYLYFGSTEAKYRPELAHLRSGGAEVSWLMPVASGAEGGGWALYAVQDLTSN